MQDASEQFGQIYDQYIEKIYRFVYLKVNSQESAEDITSRVFSNGWEAYRADPSKIQNPGAFLYQVARNMVVDHYRGKDKLKTASTERLPQMIDETVNVHEKAMINSDMEMVRTAMQNLKKDYQDVLIWHYLEDMSVEEICQILHKTNGAVRVMIHRSLNVLKDELGHLS